MRRNIKVVEINGLRGLLAVAFMVVCAGAGFIVFPAWALMSVWNFISNNIYYLPKMNLLHGFMPYAIFVLIYFATRKRKSFIGISSADLTQSHIAAIMKDLDDDK